MTKGGLMPLAIASLVFAGLGFVVSIIQVSKTTQNGVITACSFTDYGALICGALAVVLGLMAAATGGVMRNVVSLGAGLAAAVIGAYHVGRGFGLVGGPCP